MKKEDIYNFAEEVQEDLGVNLFLNDIFSDDLNHYFNYKHIPNKDIVILNFEVDEGTATIEIVNIDDIDYEYTSNENFDKYFERQKSSSKDLTYDM